MEHVFLAAVGGVTAGRRHMGSTLGVAGSHPARRVRDQSSRRVSTQYSTRKPSGRTGKGSPATKRWYRCSCPAAITRTQTSLTPPSRRRTEWHHPDLPTGPGILVQAGISSRWHVDHSATSSRQWKPPNSVGSWRSWAYTGFSPGPPGQVSCGADGRNV